jgi:hypothetical protein
MRNPILIFSVTLLIILFFSCKPPESKVSSMLDEDFLNSWFRQSKLYIDSCIGQKRASGEQFFVLRQDKYYQLRKRLIAAALEKRGRTLSAHEVVIAESSSYSGKEYYDAVIRFDDEDVGLYYHFNFDSGGFDFAKPTYREEDQFFWKFVYEGDCCRKNLRSTVRGCRYYNTFKANKQGSFDLVKFCMEYHVYDRQ